MLKALLPFLTLAPPYKLALYVFLPLVPSLTHTAQHNREEMRASALGLL